MKQSGTKRSRTIFISFTAEDRSTAREVRQALVTEFNVATGERVSPGEDIRRAIASRIEASQVVVAILPKRPSGWISSELAMATSLGKPLVLLASESALIPEFLRGEEVHVLRHAGEDKRAALGKLTRLLRDLAQGPSTALPRRHPERFEALVMRIFRDAGYEVSHIEKRADAGADILASFVPPGLTAKLTLAIECKLSSQPLGVAAVRQAAEWSKAHRDVPLLITNSKFSLDARGLAEALGVRVMDGRDLLEMANRSGSRAKTVKTLSHEIVLSE